jgi:hypothetical protein
MKTTIRNLLAAMLLVVASLQAHAQGLVYDQQSASSPISPFGNGNADGLNLQEDQPLVQSFIPSLSAIGFVQFEFVDDFPGNGNNGATVCVDLWTGSPIPNTPSAILLGSTAPIYMPNGFGSLFIGVTNFYFSTPVTLTAGQTYYLQPVVLSGDDPWDIIAIGDTYPNGQILEEGAGFSSDFWFREGIVSVPEPSTLAFIGLSSLLVLIFKRRSKLFVLLLLTVSILSVHATDSVVQVTADAAGLTPVSATALPDAGTFWVMTNSLDGELMALPYPELPSDLSALPIYSVIGNEFIVDDTGGQISASAGWMSSAQATSAAQAQAATTAALIDLIQTSTNGGNQLFQPNSLMIDTNGLWLEASNEDPYLGLRAHNTINGDNYQLLSTSNLESGWNLGEISNAPDDYLDFSPVPRTNAMTYFKVHHANPVMWIVNGVNS